MLDQLIESKRTASRSRMLAGGLFSVGAHAIMITAIICAGVDGAQHPAPIPAEPIILFPEPVIDRAPTRPPSPGVPMPGVAMEGAMPEIPFPSIEVDLDATGTVPSFDPRTYGAPGAGLGSAGAPGSDRASPDNGSVFPYQVVEERPEPLTCPMPAYPSMLRGAGVEGEVLVELVIGSDGRVEPETVAVLERSHEAFARAVIDMYRDPRCRFRPGRMAGRPVKVLVRQTTAFRIR